MYSCTPLSQSDVIILNISNDSVNETAMNGKLTWSRRWNSFERQGATDALGCCCKLMNPNRRQYERNAYQKHDNPSANVQL